MDDKAMTERCEAARDSSAGSSAPLRRQRRIWEKKHLEICAIAVAKFRKATEAGSRRRHFNAGTLNLFAGSCDQTRGFSFKGRTSISRHAVQNSACVFAESDYLKLQITNTRYQCSLGGPVPTFRSSCYASARTSHELRKVMGTGKSMISSAAFLFEVPG